MSAIWFALEPGGYFNILAPSMGFHEIVDLHCNSFWKLDDVDGESSSNFQKKIRHGIRYVALLKRTEDNTGFAPNSKIALPLLVSFATAV